MSARIGSPEWREECADMADRADGPHYFRQDPLRQMRSMRGDGDVYAQRLYMDARKRAMREPLGFAALAMCERAIRCDLACREALNTWRTAA